MDLEQPADIDGLVQELAAVLGIDAQAFATILTSPAKDSEPRSIATPAEVTNLIRDVLVKTVGMGINLP